MWDLWALPEPPAGAFEKLLPYGLGALLLIAISLWILKQFFGKVLQDFGGRFATFFMANVSANRTLGRAALNRYRRAIRTNFAQHRPGFDESQPVDIRNLYVPLKYVSDGRREDVYDRIRKELRAVITGPPGSGKSLLLKHSILTWAMEDHRSGYLPVLVELHRCNDNDATLSELIENELRLNQVRRGRSFVDKALADGALSVLFDGLDEVSRSDHHRVVTMLRDFARANPKCQMVVTCRNAVYYDQLSPEFGFKVQIADFDDASILRFLANYPEMSADDAKKIFNELLANPQLMQLAASPLLLTMIAVLYTSKLGPTGRSLPSSRPAFYDMAVHHLVGRDEDLGRDKSSKYFRDDKKAVLQRIAFAMQEAPAERPDRLSIERAELLEITKRILPDLNLEHGHATDLVNEIADRSELLVKLDRRSTRYQFRHLTLQEYLAAVELATDPNRLLACHATDRNGWRETVKLWCGVSSQECTDLLREIMRAEGDYVLALECIAGARRIDDGFAHSVIEESLTRLGESGADAFRVIPALGMVASDGRPRGREVLARLVKLAQSPEGGRRGAMAALAATRLPSAAAVLADMIEDPDARSALRSMGEHAIPALEAQAKRGRIDAVDDLAAVGTSAAAEALVAVLGLDTPAATRAAWRLAELVSRPEIEAGLRLGAVELPRRVEVLEWAWLPFREESGAALTMIMGRTALLLERSAPDDIPDDVARIDARLAIAVGVLRAAEETRDSPQLPSRALADLVLRIGREAGVDRYLFPALENASPPWWTIQKALETCTEQEKWDAADAVSAAVLAAHTVSETRRRVIAMLTPPVRSAAVSSIFCDEVPSMLVGRQQWSSVEENPAEPKIQRAFAVSVTTLTILAVVGLGGARALGTAFTFWPRGPVWLAWITVVCAAGALLVFAAVMINELGDYSLDSWFSDRIDSVLSADAREITIMLGGFGWLIVQSAGLLTFALLTAAGWIGWPATALIVVALVAAIWASWAMVSARERAISNPLRKLREIDVSSRGKGLSIIASGPV